MILVAYGDELAAAATAACEFFWAANDPFEIHRGRRPHPYNIPFGFAYKTAKLMHSGLHSAAYKDAIVDEFIHDYQNLKVNDDIAIVATWSKAHSGEVRKIEQFGHAIKEKGIPCCFINTNHQFKSQGDFWLWDTMDNSALRWATQHSYLNSYGYLTSYGHTKLANSVFIHLTKQLPNLIIEQ